MTSFSVWDIVSVPFPYTDRPVRQRRPALVVASSLQDKHGLLWVMMITSAENRGWLEDVSISNLKTAGLPAPSLVRATKISTVESHEAKFLGVLPHADRRKVAASLKKILAATVP